MELLRLYIEIKDTLEVRSKKGEVRMVGFGGTCKSPYFNGTILPGGIDAQRNLPDGTCSLSARYIVEGTDQEGNACKLYIENNGIMTGEPNCHTRPTIFTDSESLQFLENADLYGVMEEVNGQITISIRQHEED